MLIDPDTREHETDDLTCLCDPSLDPLFWRADRIDARSAWCGHIPFAHWLIATARPRTLVELGTHTGVSYAAFCSAVERVQLDTRCYAVDTWQGDEHAGEYGEQIFSQLQTYNQRRFSSFSNLIRTTFDAAVEHFQDSSIDILHIDGLHTYVAVKHDFDTWLPKLSSRAVVLFHDSNERQTDFGVWRLWQELTHRYPSFEFLHGHGLGVLATGPDAPTAIARLCALRGSAITKTRDRFSMLGERWETEQRELWSAAEQGTALERSQQKADAAEEMRDAAEEALNETRRQVESISEDRADIKELLSKAQTKIEAVSNARAELEEKMVQAITKAADTEQALVAIESSTVWRISRPFRDFISRSPNFHKTLIDALRSLRSGVANKMPAVFGKFIRQRQNVAIIEKSPLFDAQWYLKTYPDAAASGISPARHYASCGIEGKSNPGPDFDAAWYLYCYQDVAARQINPLVHFEKFGRSEGRSIRSAAELHLAESIIGEIPSMTDWSPTSASPTVHELLTKRFAPIAPLKIFWVTAELPCVTLITDSVKFDNFTGNGRTALVFAATLSEHLGYGLRVVTRIEPPDPKYVAALFKWNLSDWNKNIEFIFCPLSNHEQLPLANGDVFITTSWWITHSVKQVIDPRQIIYLIQDDESTLYANGEERMRCLETMAAADTRAVISTRLLFDHLIQTGALAAESIQQSLSWFDPTFSVRSHHDIPGSTTTLEKRQFFFLARPDQPRNLYWRGLEAIAACLDEGILVPSEWDVHFVGSGLLPVTLPRGLIPHLDDPVSADAYIKLLATIDVGLCLLSSPHPGYTVLELAAVGAQVVTDRYGAKTSLEGYSDNILCVDATVESLKQAIKSAIEKNGEKHNLIDSRSNRFSYDYAKSFEPVMSRFFPLGAKTRQHV